MFYILDAVPLPPVLDFNNVQPSSPEVFKRITESMEKRSQLVSAIALAAKDEPAPGLDPAKAAEALAHSVNMVT